MRPRNAISPHLPFIYRKKRLKRMAKDLKRQKSGKNTSSNTENGLHRFESFTRSPVRPSSTAARRDDSVSPRHPATLRKKKIEKKRMSRSIELNLVEVESGRKRSRRSVSPASDRPPSKNAHRNGEAPIEHRASGIPVPIIKSSRKEKRKSSAEKTRSKERRSSLETGIAVIDREDPYKIDMDTVRSTRDRRRWEVPATHSIEYDRNGAIRLPPLLEIRMAKTA